MHLPINHRLAGFYRFLAGLVGFYILIFGIVGAVLTWGDPLFDEDGATALGLLTNLAFALLSIVVGAIVVLGALRGGNAAHYLNMYGGGVFWLAGLAMLVLLQTDANLLNFQVSTCIVSFLIGTVLVLAGLYGRRGTKEEEEAEDVFRHSGRGPIAGKVTTKHDVIHAHPGVEHKEQ
ncbi:DUF4383 domain-containing protein [Allorhizocola rhizosphaerae]|uniref:DUF4383 domain-containing protein n=1 Tax=Allorhizocola rhizosphaerae TaxID=1872709 RepID=UPI000E3C82A5|nr:DUF4383 domain-containing protein [Allorhizocola rhizosphaerae]